MPKAPNGATAQARDACAEHEPSARVFTRLEIVHRRLQRALATRERGGETVDASADLRRFTVDVTSSLAFATDLNTLESEGDVTQRHLDKIFPAISRRLFAPVPYWRWFKLPADRELDAAVKQVHELVNGLVENARRRAASQTSADARPGNFLDAMVATQSDDTAASHRREVVGNALTMCWPRRHHLEPAGVDDAHDERAHGSTGQHAADADRVLGAASRR